METQKRNNIMPLKLHKMVIGSAFLLLSFFLAIIVAQIPQEIRQHAQSTTLTPTPTPITQPQCAAKGGQPNTGKCVSADDGCFLGEEQNEGQVDCATGETCCSLAAVPNQCAAQSNGQTFCSTAANCTGLYNAQPLAQLDCQQGTICCKNTTFPTPIISPTQAKTTTAQPTTATTLTTKPTITTVPPTATAVPTAIAPTIPLGNTRLTFSIVLHGIGNGGDNKNPLNTLSNKSPLHTSRTFTIAIGNFTRDVPLQYTNGAFTGMLDLGTSWSTGQYDIKIKSPGFMEATNNGRVIAAGEETQVSAITLTAGDSNGDIVLNALDYNAIIACYNIKEATDICDSTQKALTDLNDDGLNNGVDYNLFLREIAGSI